MNEKEGAEGAVPPSLHGSEPCSSTPELAIQGPTSGSTRTLSSSCHERSAGASPSLPVVEKAGGQWWHVNKEGFPIRDDTWEEMWQYVVETHPNGPTIARAIRGRVKTKLPLPTVPTIRESHPVRESLLAVQSYLWELQYNHTGTQFFEIRKNRPLSRLMETAKDIVHESLPIKCLEAVVLSLYLTAPLTAVQRFAVSFKSRCGDMHYRHIVLAVSFSGCYGALGLSRREKLMYKPLVFKSLHELIQDFIQSYQQYQHRVMKLRLSSPIVHDIHSCEQIQWKFLSLNLPKMDQGEVKKALEKFSRTIRTMS